MKILIVAAGDFFSDYGGGQIYVRNIVDALIECPDISVCVASFSNNSNAPLSKRIYNGVECTTFTSKSDFLDILRVTHPDVVHANGAKGMVAEVCRSQSIPCVVTAHHGGICCPAGTLMNHRRQICSLSPAPRRCLRCYLTTIRGAHYLWPLTLLLPWRLWEKIGQRSQSRNRFIPLVTPVLEAACVVKDKLEAWRRLSADASIFIAPSQALADALIRSGADDKKIVVVPHGIRDSHYGGISPQADANKKIKFYYAGRINAVKGLDTLVMAWRKLSASLSNQAELHIYGAAVTNAEKRYERMLKRLARGQRCANIVWHGKVTPETLAVESRAMDCLVHPARYLEVFGLSIAEALYDEKWVIASRCGGAEQQIYMGKNGCVVPPNRVKPLKDAVACYIQQRPAWHEAGCKPLTITEHCQRLVDVFQAATCHNTVDETISVCVITYNSAKYVEQTLNSIYNQTYRNIELIVSDDCSTDDTMLICQRFIEQHNSRFARTVLTSTGKNSGIVANYNHSLKFVKGNWVKYIAGDDLLKPQCIEKFVGFRKPKARIITCDFIQHIEETDADTHLRTALRKGSAQQQMRHMLQLACIVHGPCLFLHASTLRSLGGFDEQFPMIEDYPIAMRFLEAGYKIDIIEEPLVVWRCYSTSVSHTSQSFAESIYHAIWHYAGKHCIYFGLPLHAYNYWVDKQIYYHSQRRLLNHLLRCVDIVHLKRKLYSPKRFFELSDSQHQ